MTPFVWTVQEVTSPGYSAVLSAAMDDTQDTVPVSSITSDYGSVRVPIMLTIGSEQIYAPVLSGSTFTGCTRGMNGTSAAAHADEAAVTGVPIADTTEPLTLAEAKEQCAIHPDETGWDYLLGFLITAARKAVEGHSGRTLTQRAFVQYLNRWPRVDHFALRRNPVVSVGSIKWTDDDGVEHALTAGTDYEVDSAAKPALIALPVNGSWPAGTMRRTNPIAIRFTAGYAAGDPGLSTHLLAMRLLLSHWFAHREAVDVSGQAPLEVPLAYRSMIDLDAEVYYGDADA